MFSSNTVEKIPAPTTASIPAVDGGGWLQVTSDSFKERIEILRSLWLTDVTVPPSEPPTAKGAASTHTSIISAPISAAIIAPSPSIDIATAAVCSTLSVESSNGHVSGSSLLPSTADMTKPLPTLLHPNVSEGRVLDSALLASTADILLTLQARIAVLEAAVRDQADAPTTTNADLQDKKMGSTVKRAPS